MSKLNNNETLSNVTIPSGNAIDAINYLNNLKSLYEKGMLLFFDVDKISEFSRFSVVSVTVSSSLISDSSIFKQ